MNMPSDEMISGVYHGLVRHHRYFPVEHEFTYKVFMMYVDLDEIDAVLSTSCLWSLKRFSPAQFRRSDFYGDTKRDLKQQINELVDSRLPGTDLSGGIRLLANFRYFGFIINPISIYYCFNSQNQVSAMVLEVTNTPWKDKIQYVLECDPKSNRQRIIFNKNMHVSPFNPMDMEYDFSSVHKSNKVAVHMKNKRLGEGPIVEFDATLSLERQEIDRNKLTKLILSYPMMTLKVAGAIYWQAFKLFIKRVPVHNHPTKKISSVDKV